MLFNKEKDFVLKIVNLILIIWLIIGITILQFDVVDLIFPEREYTYEEYRAYNCKIFNGEEVNEEENCSKFYQSYLLGNEDKNSQLKRIVLSIGNIVIVSTGIILLNKERKIK